jgi:dTDP-glucose 4,6-dehydratase
MRQILVTGGAGFIGSNFVRYLLERYPSYQITVVDALTYAGSVENLPTELGRGTTGRLRFWYGNVRNAELIDTLVSQADTVIHFAAETHVTRSIYDNLTFFETDVLGTQVIANAVVKYQKSIERFIHVSSSEVYGTARAPLIDEGHPLMPMSPYASAKAGADRLVYSYWATYDIPAIIVRPFNNFGPYQHLEKAIPRFITSCILEEPLRVHGDGSAERDWLHVADHCEALDRLLHCEIGRVSGEVLNIGTGVSTSVRTIAEMVVERMRSSPSLIQYIDDRPGQVIRHTADMTKTRQILGWEARIGLEEGLDMTIDWYRKHRDWWEKQLWMREIPIIIKGEKRVVH